MSNIVRIVAATLAACVFWTVLYEVMRPSEPHPGLRDDELQEALRGDWEHRQLSYLAARKYLFKEIDGDGRDAECRYTGETIEYFSQPLPQDGLMEHAWPVTRLPSEARTDLHHLSAVIPEARAARLNLHFGKVLVPLWSRGGSRSGASSGVKPVFEVRDETRGDVARAMFYVATMYQQEIPDAEEKELKAWHRKDPVSTGERRRNDRVEKRQKSRNPFIDHPGLVDRISDF